MKSKQNINYLSGFFNLCSLTFGIILSVVLLLFVIQHYSFNEDYFKQQFLKNNVSAATGFDGAALVQIARQITGYLSGRESSVNLTLPAFGKETLVFNRQELAHMLDVKVIFVLLDRVKRFGLLLMLAVFVPYSLYIYFSCRKHRNARTVWLQRRYWINISKVLAFNGGFTLLLSGGLILMILTNFSKFFTYFRQIFFDNTLWLLSSNGRLRQMLPERFFYDTGLRVLGHYAFISLILGAAGLIFFTVLKKDESAL